MKRQIIDANIRGVPLPAAVHGCILPNADGTFDIYYNSLFGRDECLKVLEHEFRHLKLDHLYDGNPVFRNEREADGD